MGVRHLRPGLIGIALIATAVALPAGAAAAQAASAATAPALQDSSLFEVAAVRARLAAPRQEPAAATGRTRRADPALARYLAGIGLVGRGQFDSSLAPLSAAASASPNTARYHGDLAYALARLSRWDTAAVEYASAARLQPANPWYDVGLAAVRAEQGQWEQAKANLQAAVALDSSIIDRRVVAAAIECMEQGGFGPELVTWLRIATVRYPDDPAPWFRLATLLRRTDSTEGLVAIRRYRALAPDQLAGAALYAVYLLGIAQYDSALALARASAADTALRRYVWPVFLQFGAQLFRARNFDLASQLLEEGREYAPAARRPQFSLFLGYANAQRLGPLYADAARKKDCAKAHAVDSLEASVRRDFAEGKAVGDSTQINQLLGGILTQARTRIGELLAQCPKP